MAIATIPRADEPTTASPSLKELHERSTVVPIVSFVLAFGGWVAGLTSGLLVGGAVFRGVLVVPLTLCAGQLFMIGHDAAHGSHARSRWMNEVIGRLALLPSLHVFGLWRAHHDTHHRYTNLAGRDFVWAPLPPERYAALRPWRQRLYRLYRHDSGVGLGLYYTLTIWIPRMLWPRRGQGLARRRSLAVDAIVLGVVAVAGAVLAVTMVSTLRPDHGADPTYWTSVVGSLVVFPLLATHWMIGWVVYLNHTHPDIVWYDDPDEWSRRQVQVEGSAGVEFDGRARVAWPRRIMHHTAHHVDPGVPLRNVGEAQRRLRLHLGDRIVSYRWSVATFRSILAHCKLYDFRSRTWVGYAAVPGDDG